MCCPFACRCLSVRVHVGGILDPGDRVMAARREAPSVGRVGRGCSAEGQTGVAAAAGIEAIGRMIRGAGAGNVAESKQERRVICGQG